jgi:phosphohistidine phosphatase
MELVILRHADALALGERGITQDADRPLSEKGEAQAHALATMLQNKGFKLDKVVTSPLLRARQTAEEIIRLWPAPAPELHVCPDLAPDGKPKKVARFLREIGGSTVALVGHQPDLGKLTAWFAGGKNARLDLAKAGMAHLVCARQPRKREGILDLLITPEWYS